MKAILYALIPALIFISCKKGDSNNNNNNNNTGKCATISSFNVTQQSDVLQIDISSTGTFLYYEVNYQPASSSPTPGNYYSFTITSSGTKSLSDLSVTPGGTWVFYVRSICSDGAGDWSTAKVLTINDFCPRPTNLGMSVFPSGMGLHWQVNGSAPAAFDVEYGLHGFSIGTGTTATVATYPFYPAMQANTDYDFYVRSSCGAIGLSSLAGPFTYHSTASQNMCTTPSNVQWTIETNGLGQHVGANFTWNQNGETEFEYTWVAANQPVSSGSIHTISNTSWPTLLVPQDTNYDFYVRAVCASGSRTPWAGPTRFNIGH